MAHAAISPFSKPLEFPPLLRGIFTALLEEVQTLRRRDQHQQTALANLRTQFEQAARFQRELLPSRLPNVDGLCIHTFYRPAETVSGDWYDVVRLDDRRTAFLLADATGHGLPAGMLATLARRCFDRFRTAEHPADSLERANHDMLGMALCECSLVGAIHAIYDETTRVVTLSRAGLPYPILAPRDGSPRELPCAGPALGAILEATFETLEIKLRPGDRLVLRTDGVDALLLENKGKPQAGALRSSPWFDALSTGRLESRLGELDDALASARSAERDLDDVTIMALEAA